MNLKKRTKAIQLLTGLLTLCITFGASFVGVYSVAAATEITPQTPTQADGSTPEYVTVDFSGISITGQTLVLYDESNHFSFSGVHIIIIPQFGDCQEFKFYSLDALGTDHIKGIVI